jgi:predicted RNase H-like HicB family nuclease
MKNILRDSLNSYEKLANSDATVYSSKSARFREAQKIASDYQIIVEKHNTLGFMGSCIEIPGINAHGKNPSICFNRTQEALATAIATLIENGQPIPESSNIKRTIQINIRLTPREKYILTKSANKLGFKGLSDFLRVCAMQKITEKEK